MADPLLLSEKHLTAILGLLMSSGYHSGKKSGNKKPAKTLISAILEIGWAIWTVQCTKLNSWNKMSSRINFLNK